MELAKEIIRYQQSILYKKGDEILNILRNLEMGPEEMQKIPMLLALILKDEIYFKYGYEEEDFMNSLNQEAIASDPQFTEVFMNMEMGIMDLMQKLQAMSRMR